MYKEGEKVEAKEIYQYKIGEGKVSGMKCSASVSSFVNLKLFTGEIGEVYVVK